MSFPQYVLVTPAHNEERLIGQTISCVLAQSVLPRCWVIVSDASTDATDRIVAAYARSHNFIRHCRVTEAHARDFGRRINAINVGVGALGDEPFEYIGCLDADVTFAAGYFEELIRRFLARPRLGLAAGVIQEAAANGLPPLRGEELRTVANAAQLFRRRCYDQIGGYPPLPYGGPDTYAEVAARMHGWQVQTFYDLRVDHHRYTASAGGLIRGRLRQGYKDFSFGYHPAFEVFKCARRVIEKPLIIGSVVRMAGYCWSYARGDRPAVSKEFVAFLQREQQRRLLEYLLRRNRKNPIPAE